jgi:hypothetical protein
VNFILRNENRWVVYTTENGRDIIGLFSKEKEEDIVST